MNKAVTDGLVLTPPEFADGLDVWSRGDGTAGSPTYQGAADAVLVSADADFSGCLELQKTQTTQTLRYMGQTPILAGCYLRVSARVKAMSGPFPTVRIAAYAGQSGGTAVPGAITTGPSVTLDTYGEVVTISAIVGSGSRAGVDMPWGTTAAFGHFGVDLTGPDTGVIRIDDIQIDDVTYYFHRNMMDWVDVRDFGAAGDGVTDDTAAFQAADIAALGREILVPAGTYLLNSSVTLNTPARFEGTVTMPADKVLALVKNFDLPTYVDAFGDELLGFKKAFQALINFSDHDSLDMGGRRIEVDGPIDLQAAVANQTGFQIRRVLRNGQINLTPGANWDDIQVTSAASFNAANPDTLTSVANVANVPVGALVAGTGVGREVFVKAVNVGAATVTLSQPLWGPPGTQTYTFARFQYALDFSNFTVLDKFELESVEVQCNGHGSAILLPPAGRLFQVRDCAITKPKDRGITSIGDACQGIHIDGCQFRSNEESLAATARTSVAFNVNANDAKVRDSRFSRFRHTGVVGGSGHMFIGNHWFQGDDVTDSARLGGIILTQTNVKTTFTGNYVDNASIEWTNEHDGDPDFASEFSFGGLTVIGNTFTASDAASFTTFLTIKPFGSGHFVNGLTVEGNVFKAISGNIDRVEVVDSSIAPLDLSRTRRVLFQGNAYNGIDNPVSNPATEDFTVASPQATWTLGFDSLFPFDGIARRTQSVVVEGSLTNGVGAEHWGVPHATTGTGAGQDEVQLTWSEPVQGKVTVTARIDNPN